MAGEQGLGASPALAVHGLVIFAKFGLRESFGGRSHLVVSQEQASQHDGEFTAAAVAAPALPTGMAVLDKAPIIDADLDHINEQALLVLSVVVEHEHEAADGLGLANPLAIMRHILHGLVKAEETGVEPGPLEDAHPGQEIGGITRERQAAEQITAEVAGEVDSLPAIAIGRAKGISRKRLPDAGQDGQGLEGTIVTLLAAALAVVKESCFLVDLKADGRGQTIAWFHFHRRERDQIGVAVVPDAGVKGDFIAGWWVEHRAIAHVFAVPGSIFLCFDHFSRRYFGAD